MARPDRIRGLWQHGAARKIFAAAVIAAIFAQPAFALITGGEGNEPLRDPGWPAGAAAMFNTPARIAWWEGPPFGGGQWHAECRGDAQALNTVLADFAKLDVKSKRIIVHDGVGHSFWLNPNRESAKQAPARMDWMFIVWQPANWERLRQMPADLNPTDPSDRENGPPAQIDIYVGGNVRWDDIVVSLELQIIDERLEAHGFSIADGTVLEGTITDLATKQPIAGRVQLERIEPQPTGGYRYTPAGDSTADAQGSWVVKNAPAGWHRIIFEAEGYVPRIVGYGRFDDQPKWHSYNSGLSKAASVSGQVTDDAGQPLARVAVRLGNVAAEGEGRYESPQEYKTTTAADGRFQLDSVPAGTATVRIHKAGYCRPGLGLKIETPKSDVALSMIRSASLQVTVDFSATTRPEAYIVEIEPEGGSKIGTWGGSGHIDANNQMTFSDVPPGRYVLKGRPNPGSEREQTDPVVIDLQGGQSADVSLSAK